MCLGEIQELIDSIPEEWTEDDLMEMSASKPVPDDQEENIEEAVPVWQRVPIIQECFWLFLWYGPFYDKGTEAKVAGEEGLVHIETFLEKWKNKEVI